MATPEQQSNNADEQPAIKVIIAPDGKMDEVIAAGEGNIIIQTDQASSLVKKALAYIKAKKNKEKIKWEPLNEKKKAASQQEKSTKKDLLDTAQDIFDLFAGPELSSAVRIKPLLSQLQATTEITTKNIMVALTRASKITHKSGKKTVKDDKKK